ncbi:TonB-dependent receptor [Polaribacter sp. MSW13]|uniref:TonB-dependent receptor n=1 Tax=Polaribacter marinus TaxID=2916838 RepID=A0A9X1VQ94_9FLAO|nr:TonB-dependent receptor [Polaribacter marinus]MCI2230316.1 TonB-dependent receptor [Polaribacter marinus]
MKKEINYIFLLFSITFFSQNYTVHGVISDANNGERLIGATVFIPNTNSYAISNSYGFYSLEIPKGISTLKVSYLGYKTYTKSLNITENILLNINLTEDSKSLNEILIRAKGKNDITNSEPGSHILNLDRIKKLPAVAGEVDILKGLQLLPGIQTSHEGTTNLSIRGGSHDQNLFLLDDAPIYNPSHALGFFSVFNPDAIKNVKVYKSFIPSQFGGRLSSVVDVRMKEGNNKEQKISGGVGLIASRFTIESPIVKEKSSFMLSGRYSYAGLTSNTLGSVLQSLGVSSLNNFSPNNEINFFDINAKVNVELNEKNHLYFSTYIGRDHFFYIDIDDSSSMDWGNVIGNLRWNHTFNSKLFSNTMLVYSKYDYSYILKDDTREFKWSANMQELDLKSDFDFFANASNHLKFGFSVENHFYEPGKLTPRNTESITRGFELDDKKTIEGSVYINNTQKIGNNFKVNYGLRYSNFFLLGNATVNQYDKDFNITATKKYNNGELVKFYQGLEPRISTNYILNNGHAIKASYTRTQQYQHLISNSTVGLPTDVWLPSDTHIKPQTANQYSLGYYGSAKDRTFDFFTEVYYKSMDNVIDYIDNADLFLNPNIETQVLSGTGEAYGIEFLLEKKTGKFNGFLSYTWSNTARTIEGINNSRSYPTSFNKQHNISTTFSYEFSERFTISSIFKFTSGGYITLPEGTFNFYGVAFNYYSERNGYRLPAYHRMDISANLKSKNNINRKWQGEWSFGIYNLYNRENIFSLFVKQDNTNLEFNKTYKMYLYGFSPYVGYNFKF